MQQTAWANYCKDKLGKDVLKCMIVRLSPGKRPTDYKIESMHTDNGISVGMQTNPDATWTTTEMIIKGIRMEGNMGIFSWTPPAKLLTASYHARFDGIEAIGNTTTLYGGHQILVNSYLHDGGHCLDVAPNQDGTPLQVTQFTNNYLERCYGKSIVFTMPTYAKDVLAVKQHWNVSRDGYNIGNWNTIYYGGAINGGGLNGWLIENNYFGRGGVQECIFDMANEARYSRIHHNWCEEGIGNGISLSDYSQEKAGILINDFEISDNQYYHSPGGIGTDLDNCDKDKGCYPGSAWAISLDTGPSPPQICQNLTIENNLMAEGRGSGGIGLKEMCKNMVVRNNTVTGAAGAMYGFLFNPLLPAQSPIGVDLQVVDNVVSDLAINVKDGSDLFEGFRDNPKPVDPPNDTWIFPNYTKFSGNYFDYCPENKNNPVLEKRRQKYCTRNGLAEAPVFADPAKKDYRIINATYAKCAGGTPFTHSGFNYLEERCDAGTAIPNLDEFKKYRDLDIEQLMELVKNNLQPQ